AASGLTAAGVQQVVSGVTPGKVYQFVAYQDLLTADFGADGHRYVMNFGVHPTGGTDPGAPETSGRIGGARWMTPSQAFWNDTPGSAAYFSGFHRSTAAFAATGSSISLWSGLTIDNAGVRDDLAAPFDTDHAYLLEGNFPANPARRNGSFEGTVLDLQDGGDTIPEEGVPAGGGIGQFNAWQTGSFAARSGAAGLRIGNRRGTVNAGMMQRI